MNRHIALHSPHGTLRGYLERPELPCGLILIARAHLGAAEAAMASELSTQGVAILTMELLTAPEIRFADAMQNVPRLTQRLIDILDLIRNDGDMEQLPLGIYVSGDLAPAAVRAAAQRDRQVSALACHGGLIDRAGGQALDLLQAPLLILLDADDTVGLTASHRAASHLHNDHQIRLLQPAEAPLNQASAWLIHRLTR
jgi:hypothetical protein